MHPLKYVDPPWPLCHQGQEIENNPIVAAGEVPVETKGLQIAINEEIAEIEIRTAAESPLLAAAKETVPERETTETPAATGPVLALLQRVPGSVGKRMPIEDQNEMISDIAETPDLVTIEVKRMLKMAKNWTKKKKSRCTV